MFIFRKLFMMLAIAIFAVGFSACPPQQGDSGDTEINVEQKEPETEGGGEETNVDVDVESKGEDY